MDHRLSVLLGSCSLLFAQIYYNLWLFCAQAEVSLQVYTHSDTCITCVRAIWMCILQERPVLVHSHCTHGQVCKYVVQPVGASKYLSNLLSLHPVFCTSISGCLCSAISGSALDHDICLTFLIPLSQRHGEVPHTSFSRCLNTLAASPSFFLLEMWSVSWRQTPEQRGRGGQISLAGLTATVRTCVTLRKYLLEEHRSVTASYEYRQWP